MLEQNIKKHRIINSKSTQRSLLRSLLEILSETDTDPFECTSPDVY